MLHFENNTHNYPVKFETAMQGAELKVIFTHAQQMNRVHHTNSVLASDKHITQ